MTISYSDNFTKVLLKWKGSLWKCIWRDLLVFLVIYYTINFSYRFFMTEDQKREFRILVAYCESATSYIPLTFLLGFFVSTVIARWWEQCIWLPWPDKLMTMVTTHIRGEKYLVLRRTVGRWLNLSAALCFRNLSSRTLKRFPTMTHFVQAGLMTPDELITYESTEGPHGKWWLPLVWICNLFKECHDQKVIDSILLNTLMKESMAYRLCLVMLVVYNWFSIPLVYTEVVTIATYGYFAICLIGRQIVGEPDLYVPIFTLFQFSFYVGWLKVGEDYIDPFGEDDADFDMNYILDRNLQISYMLACDAHDQLPDFQRDMHWGQTNPQLPYTKASLMKRDNVFKGHLAEVTFKEDEMTIIEPGDDEYHEDEEYIKKFQDVVLLMARNRKANLWSQAYKENGSVTSSVENLNRQMSKN